MAIVNDMCRFIALQPLRVLYNSKGAVANNKKAKIVEEDGTVAFEKYAFPQRFNDLIIEVFLETEKTKRNYVKYATKFFRQWSAVQPLGTELATFAEYNDKSVGLISFID